MRLPFLVRHVLRTKSARLQTKQRQVAVSEYLSLIQSIFPTFKPPMVIIGNGEKSFLGFYFYEFSAGDLRRV